MLLFLQFGDLASEGQNAGGNLHEACHRNEYTQGGLLYLIF
jgi:hypothetical protein